MGFRFIHTADWQVGKAFGNVPGDAGSALRAQRIKTVETIAALAAQHGVDAVLVAGDAFDDHHVGDRTLHQTMEALKGFPGPWVFLPGNHDAALAHGVWTRLRAMGLPANVIVADVPEPVRAWGDRAVVLPAPLRRRREAIDQTEWFDAAPSSEGTARVGLAHGTVEGTLPEAAGAHNVIPRTRADTAGLAYLALGDWHGAQMRAPRIWYSGTPETDRHADNDTSGVVHLVDVDGGVGGERITELRVGHYRWLRHELSLGDGRAAPLIDFFDSQAADAFRSVLALKITGAVSLAERRHVEDALRRHAPRFHHVEVDDTALLDAPTPDDLDGIDRGGFVRLAVERLKAKAADATDPERAAAALALRLLYLDHVGQV